MENQDQEIVGAFVMTYILAEIGSAHMGDPDLCIELIHKAKEAGADGVKVQVWFPDEGDFSHMMDKFMGEDGYKKILENWPIKCRTLIQYYGDKSISFCVNYSLSLTAVDARNKRIPWTQEPIIGHQLYPKYYAWSL